MEWVERVAAFATIGGLFLVAGLALIGASGERSLVFLVFAFCSVAAPPMAAWLVYIAQDERGRLREGVRIALLAAKVLLFYVLLSFLLRMLGKSSPLAGLSKLLDAIVFISAVAIFFKRRGLPVWLSENIDAALIVALGVAVFVLSPLEPRAPIPIGLVDYAVNAPRFAMWAIAGILWAATGIWLCRSEGRMSLPVKGVLTKIAGAAAAVVVLSVYDDTHFADFSHYLPLVGPAMHMVHHGVPMVDTYSVYGLLPWLLQRAAFGLFDQSFGTTAVVVRCLNLAYFFVILFALLSVTRRRISAVWFFVPALLMAITSHGPGVGGMFNMNALPMTLGGREILPSTMAFLLIVGRNGRLVKFSCFVVAALASLSSVEIFVFTLGTWGYATLIEAVRLRSAAAFTRWLAAVAATVVFAHAVFAAVIYLSSGALVDYLPYLDMFFQFRPAEESQWSMPFVPNYALWFPIGFAYFLVVAGTTYRAYMRNVPDALVDRLLPFAIFGLGPLAYFFGRPQEATLGIAWLPFCVVAIAVAEVVFGQGRRFGAAGKVLAGAMAVSFAFAFADSFEHFMRPLNPERGNSTVLRRCLSRQGCSVPEVAHNIRLALTTDSLDPRTQVGYAIKAGGPRERIEEASDMVRRLAHDGRPIGLLTDIFPTIFGDSDSAVSVAAYMTTGRWFPWSISSPLNDGLAPIVAARILAQAKTTPTGTLIVVPNDRKGWLLFDRGIYDAIVARCQLKLVEQGRYLSAFVTDNCPS